MAAILVGLCLACSFDMLRQQLTVIQLRKLGASVGFRCGNVVGVYFSPTSRSVGDDEMPLLKGLWHLEELYLEDTQVTLKGMLDAVRQHPHLETIAVLDAHLSKAGEDQLKKIKPGIGIERLIKAPDDVTIVK